MSLYSSDWPRSYGFRKPKQPQLCSELMPQPASKGLIRIRSNLYKYSANWQYSLTGGPNSGVHYKLSGIAKQEMKRGRVRWENDIDDSPGIYVFVGLVDRCILKVGQTGNLRENIPTTRNQAQPIHQIYLHIKYLESSAGTHRRTVVAELAGE